MQDVFNNDLSVGDQVLYVDCGRNGDFTLAEIQDIKPDPNGKVYKDKVVIRLGKTSRYKYTRETLTVANDRVVKIDSLKKLFDVNPRDEYGRLICIQ